jgi:formate dehydrogenase subunit gamma
VVSFYHDFRAKADPRPAVQLCRAEACQARGVEALVAAGERAAGNRVRISTVYCLGLCSAGPAARVGDSLHAKLDEAALVRLIEAV